MYKDDEGLQKFVTSLYQANKVIGAICHGSLMLGTATKDDALTAIADRLPMTGFNHVLRELHTKNAILRNALTGNPIDLASSEEGVRRGDFTFPGDKVIPGVTEDPYYQAQDIECLVRHRNVITGRHYFDMRPLTWEMIKAIQEQSGLVEKFSSVRIPGINNALRSDIVEGVLIATLQQFGIPRSAIRDIQLKQESRRVFSSFKKANIMSPGAEDIANEVTIEFFKDVDASASELQKHLRHPEAVVQVFDLATKKSLDVGADTFFAPSSL
eukprot:gnl/TRDRNA2_/TRDRNA2_137612_c0_seq1.p1 gnl/TRDRNA2_/TRDRNA2_137612_c0~~gnl/TRDRNA2_/TRDRNA2_137612_c0_seq1.p1  ORF type:complete len:314 (+),score=44.00 gnl/TRDRNA2_/TRDRNA2_137612_c0_seq1:135-944(+)